MVTPDDKLTEVRDAYLASIKQVGADWAMLIAAIEKAEQAFPDLFEATCISEEPIDLDEANWDADYFSRQHYQAKTSFTRERIEHLIALRKYLRENGVEGFVPTKKTVPPRREKEMNNHFIPSDNLQDFFNRGDLLGIRTALRMELSDNSLTDNDLRGALCWTEEKVAGLFEPYEEKAFARAMSPDRNSWNIKYYEGQIVSLTTNFAKERFLHLIDVRERLRQQGAEGFAALPPKSRKPDTGKSSKDPSDNQAEPPRSKPQSDQTFKHMLAIGGAIAALAAFLISLLRRP